MTEPAPPGFDANVQAYDDQVAEESRLEIGSFRLEELHTHELSLRHAPQPPTVVLDVGGAAHIYPSGIAELDWHHTPLHESDNV